MITINYTNENGAVILERELTEDEKSSVTSVLYNGSVAVFYQNDEPTEEIPQPTNEKPIPVVDVVGLLKTLSPEEIQEIKNILLK